MLKELELSCPYCMGDLMRSRQQTIYFWYYRCIKCKRETMLWKTELRGFGHWAGDIDE